LCSSWESRASRAAQADGAPWAAAGLGLKDSDPKASRAKTKLAAIRMELRFIVAFMSSSLGSS
jgi:hypothetical protein